MAYHRVMELLLVEDELEIQDFLKASLADAGYEVDVAGDGKTAESLASAKVYDALIVDLGLPDQDGIDLILRLRHLGVSSPVLILSARRSIDDRVRGLEQGGDDYLTKPFALAELLARLRNLLRRNVAATASPTFLRVVDLELDLLKRRASRGGELLNLYAGTPVALSRARCFWLRCGACAFSRIQMWSMSISIVCAVRLIQKAVSHLSRRCEV
jgi:DNA-binding response OmpR family regulator